MKLRKRNNGNVGVRSDVHSTIYILKHPSPLVGEDVLLLKEASLLAVVKQCYLLLYATRQREKAFLK